MRTKCEYNVDILKKYIFDERHYKQMPTKNLYVWTIQPRTCMNDTLIHMHEMEIFNFVRYTMRKKANGYTEELRRF